MSNEPNGHFAAALHYLSIGQDVVAAIQSSGNPTQRDELGKLAFGTWMQAQAEATLALAHEQRTANLIALWSMQDETAMSLDKSNGMNVAEWSSVAQQIRERLGL